MARIAFSLILAFVLVTSPLEASTASGYAGDLFESRVVASWQDEGRSYEVTVWVPAGQVRDRLPSEHMTFVYEFYEEGIQYRVYGSELLTITAEEFMHLAFSEGLEIDSFLANSNCCPIPAASATMRTYHTARYVPLPRICVKVEVVTHFHCHRCGARNTSTWFVEGCGVRERCNW